MEIFEINKIKEKNCGFGGGNKGKSVATLALIPNDVGLGPIFTDLIGRRDEHEEHEVETREISWETKRITSKSC